MNRSFADIVKKFARLHEPSLEYKGGDFQRWQADFKAKIESLRGRQINRFPMKADMEEKKDCKTHWRQKVTINATEISDATGYLLTPKAIAGKMAAIIASPGHYKFGKNTVAGHDCAQEELSSEPSAAYAKYAVETGYVVFVPDWWGWGDKSGHLDMIYDRDKCNVIQMAASMYGISVLNLHMLEADAVVDFLQGLDFVDDKRIGIIGNSYGGRMAMWITAFNNNICCAVSAGAMNLFSERADKLLSCAIQYFPGILEYGDVDQVFSLIAPRALQLQAGLSDSLITAVDRDKIAETIGKAYQACGSAENLDVKYLDGGHHLDWPVARDFLQKFL